FAATLRVLDGSILCIKHEATRVEERLRLFADSGDPERADLWRAQEPLRPPMAAPAVNSESLRFGVESVLLEVVSVRLHGHHIVFHFECSVRADRVLPV